MKDDTPKKLSRKQAATVQAINEKCKTTGTFPTPDTVVAAVREVYNCGSEPKKALHTAQTIAGQLMDKPEFRAAMGFETPEIQEYVAGELLKNLRGENTLWPQDKELYQLALKLVVRATFPEQSKIVYADENQYANRSIEDLRFCAANGRFPEDPEPKPEPKPWEPKLQ